MMFILTFFLREDFVLYHNTHKAIIVDIVDFSKEQFVFIESNSSRNALAYQTYSSTVHL